jgi:hypothetical protein
MVLSGRWPLHKFVFVKEDEKYKEFFRKTVNRTDPLSGRYYIR